MGNENNTQRRRTDGAERRGNPSEGGHPRPRARRDIPERSASAGRIGAEQRGQKKRPAAARRAPETGLQKRDTDNRSLVEIVRSRAVAKRRERDEEWDRTEIQRQRHGVDRPMLIIIIVLIVLGTMMVFSASYPSALREKDDSLYYIRNQLLWVAIGSVVMTAVCFIPYQFIKKLAPSVAIVAVALLLMVLVMGTARGVAQRWLIIGPLSLQPSEPAKAALILFLAYYIDKHYSVTSKRLDKKLTFRRGILMPGLIVAVFAGLVLLEKHLSGAIILGLIGVAIIFASGADILKMALCYGIPAGGAGLIYLLTNDYAMKRILTHSDENADVLKEAWQTTQGLYAIGSGGLLGLGLGESNLKYNYVSEAHNDFIFTIWCEELGLVGAVLLIALYGLFIWRGFVIAKKAPDTFSSLTAFGITFQVAVQATLNILVVTDIFPNTGVSLPFFSYGGSSLVMLMAEMGVLLSISRHSYQKK